MVALVLTISGAVLAAFVTFWLVAERGRPLRSSTWRIIQLAGVWPFFTVKGLHGYLYARYPNIYIRMFIGHIYGWLRPAGKQWLANRYHAKVLSPENARSIITLNRDIPLQDVEQIVPYSHARQLLLQGPPDVVALECPCRLARANPCQPTQVCMVIGQPFADFILQHHPSRSRRLTQTEALDMLRDEHRRGHVHAAWFKDACLDRFFAICNCCKCCCGGIDAMLHHGIPMMASSGFVATVDPELCHGCGDCQSVCPFGAIHMNDQLHVDPAVCMGCGVCEGQCDQHAISLTRCPERGIPLDVRLLQG